MSTDCELAPMCRPTASSAHASPLSGDPSYCECLNPCNPIYPRLGFLASSSSSTLFEVVLDVFCVALVENRVTNVLKVLRESEVDYLVTRYKFCLGN